MRRPRWSVTTIAIVAVVTLPVVAVGSPDPNVEICHFNADDDPDAPEWELLEISANSVEAHESHGDGFPGQEVPGTAGEFVFDENCVSQRAEFTFAVAYVDADPTDGTYNRDLDLLIAKLVEGDNNDGVLGPGDLVVTHWYPKNFVPNDFAEFRERTHTVEAVTLNDGVNCAVRGPTGFFSWQDSPRLQERYIESVFVDELFAQSIFRDVFDDVDNLIATNEFSPSRPVGFLNLREKNPADQTFLDVELNCTTSG